MITPGVGIGGVKLGQFAKVVNRGPDNQVVKGRKTRGFGRVHRFCFEGDLCSWKVQGGGFFSVTLNTLEDELIAMNTNAEGYVTPEGIGVGSGATEVVAAYPSATKRRRCVEPAGAEVTGYVLRRRGNFTIFALDSQAVVDRVHVVQRAYVCR